METRVCNFSRARKELKMKYITANEIAENLRSADTWDAELCAALCEEAGMTAEWEAADGDTFESVVEAAAAKLGVEIYRK